MLVFYAGGGPQAKDWGQMGLNILVSVLLACLVFGLGKWFFQEEEQ